MGRFGQWIKKLFKSKRSTILRKPYEDMNEFYTIHEELGNGTYGVTYRCTEKSTGQSYACKKISKMRRSQADHEKNIGREVEIMQLLSGRPNIVGFKSVHEDEQFVHLVMDLCDERDTARICRQIVEAVHACHSIHVMHRDVKPQNLLFSITDHNNALLKLSDFGVSVFINEGRYEEDRVGTAPYTAPEVIDYKYGKEADMWSSAGVILHSLLSGVLPFRGAHPWIRSHEGKRKSLMKKLLKLITIKKLKELARKARNKIKIKKTVRDRSRRRRYNYVG